MVFCLPTCGRRPDMCYPTQIERPTLGRYAQRMACASICENCPNAVVFHRDKSVPIPRQMSRRTKVIPPNTKQDLIPPRPPWLLLQAFPAPADHAHIRNLNQRTICHTLRHP